MANTVCLPISIALLVVLGAIIVVAGLALQVVLFRHDPRGMLKLYGMSLAIWAAITLALAPALQSI